MFMYNVHKSYISTEESLFTVDRPLNLVQVSTCILFVLFYIICTCIQHLVRSLFSVKMVYSITVYRESEIKSSNYNKINMHACWFS